MCYQIWNLPIRSFGNLAYPKPSTCDSGGEARGVTHYCSIFPSGACLSLEESLSDGTIFLRMSSHPHNLVHVPLWQLLPRGGLFRGHPLLSSYLILNHISPSIPRSIQCHLLIPTVAPLFIAHCYAYSIDLVSVTALILIRLLLFLCTSVLISNNLVRVDTLWSTLLQIILSKTKLCCISILIDLSQYYSGRYHSFYNTYFPIT